MMSMQSILQRIGLVLLCVFFPATVAAGIAPIAVFPLRDLSLGGNGINIPLTQYLASRLAENGSEVINLETIISFMANNRIRTSGQLETFHIKQVQEELGAAFILLGTVTQAKEIPIPSLGLTLNLIRTDDARTIWSYVGAVSGADIQTILGIADIKSIAGLEIVLGNDIMTRWPGEIVNREQVSSVSIDSIVLEPQNLSPGGEIYCSVTFRNIWQAGRAPRVFFKADDQIHAASLRPGSNTYEASWVVGDRDGRYAVTLILEWPFYGRIETVPLGFYVVDGAPPLLNVDLKGEQMQGDPPIFTGDVTVVPSLLIRKPIDRWRITFKTDTDIVLALQEGKGDLPEWFTWEGVLGDFDKPQGLYKVVLDVWDEAGNIGSATKEFELNRSIPSVTITAEKKEQEMVLDLQRDSKLPLAFWRLEMWSEEGKLLKAAEGRELPAQVKIDLPANSENQNIEGLLMMGDVLGHKTQKEIKGLLPVDGQETEKETEKGTKPGTQTWVEDF
jgi:TolB-like protein